MSRLQREQQAAAIRIDEQEETNQTLTAQIETQDANINLEQEMYIKSQLLENTTNELTRSLYVLDQEWTFHITDTEYSHQIQPSTSIQEVVLVDSLTQSVNKAEQIRQPITSTPRDASSSSSCLQTRFNSIVRTDRKSQCYQVEDYTTEQIREEAGLQLTDQIEEELLMQEDTQTREQANVTIGLSLKKLLVMMSEKQNELEGRLDDMLSRIAMETQEIKELEKQLTDGQILANEALQRDLEGIIYGLQEYLRSLREQAQHAQQQIESLQTENHSLQLHLGASQRHCSQLEDAARSHRQDMADQLKELSLLRLEARTLRDKQVEGSRQQMELEAELQQLREQLTQQITLGQLQRDALQAALNKEKHTREMTESRLQSSIIALQEEKSSLQQIVEGLPAQLYQTKAQPDQTRIQNLDTKIYMDQPKVQIDQRSAAFLDLLEVKRDIEEQKDISPVSPENMCSRGAEHFYRVIQNNRTDREMFQQDHNQSQDQIATLQAQLVQYQERVTQLETQIRSQSDEHKRSLNCVKRKLCRCSRLKCDSDQQIEEQLKSTFDKLRDLNHIVELLHSQCDQNSGHELDGSEHTPTPQSEDNHSVEELRAELAKAQRLTHELRQKLHLTNRTNTEDGGQWCFIPPGHNAPTFGSQGTHDSGLGLQYFSSPERRQEQDKPPTGGGYWVYVPPTHTDSGMEEWADTGGGSDANRTPRGPTPPTPPVTAPAVLSYGQNPLVGPAWVPCGSPAAGVYGLSAEGAALHCNIPQHKITDGGKCVCDCMHQESEKLKEEITKLRLEANQLRHTVSQNRNVKQVCYEVECVEKTLLKRRAELRHADRLLLEAQNCLQINKDKASSAQHEADILQCTAQESATCLLDASHQIKEFQKELEELRRNRQDEEKTLREVKETLRSRKKELQQLSANINSSMDRVSNVLSDLQESQKHLHKVTCQLEQQEQSLVQRREELQTAENRLERVKEEERHVQNRVKELLEQQEVLLSEQMSTASALREEEQRLIALRSELNTHRAELKQVLQELLAEQQELKEVKSQRSKSLQRLHKKQYKLDQTQAEVERTMKKLDSINDEIDRKKADLERTRDEFVELKNNIAKGNEEHEKKQEDLNRNNVELEKLQREYDRRREELTELQQKVESYTKETEIHLKETKAQQTEMQELQEELTRRREERSSVQEQCKHLEARRRHADRSLSAVEAELSKQREELSRLKQEVVRNTDATQEQLNENSELLSLLSERLEEKKKHLQTLEQKVSVSSQQQQQREEELNQLEGQIQHKQAVCVGLEEAKAVMSKLEDRGHRLAEQEKQLSNLEEELCTQEKLIFKKGEELREQEQGLHLKEKGLQRKEEGLQHMEEELRRREEELRVKEKTHKTEDEKDFSREEEMKDEEDESFYLSTSPLRSSFSAEEERWKVELQREKLRQQEHRLKARLHCSLWNQQENLKVKRLETEESLLGLKHRLDQLDSLLTQTP